MSDPLVFPFSDSSPIIFSKVLKLTSLSLLRCLTGQHDICQQIRQRLIKRRSIRGHDPSVAQSHHMTALQCVVYLSALEERLRLHFCRYFYHQHILLFYGDRV